MSKLASIRKEYAIIDAVAKWQNTLWYPALFAVLCAVAGSGNCYAYAPVFWIYCALVVFSALFADDLKVFIPPIFFFYCSLGSDLSPEQLLDREASFDSFSTAGLVNFIAAGLIMVVALIVKLAVSGAFKKLLNLRGGIFYSMIAMSAALMLNGIFSEGASLKNLCRLGYIAFVRAVLHHTCGLARLCALRLRLGARRVSCRHSAGALPRDNGISGRLTFHLRFSW